MLWHARDRFAILDALCSSVGNALELFGKCWHDLARCGMLWNAFSSHAHAMLWHSVAWFGILWHA